MLEQDIDETNLTERFRGDAHFARRQIALEPWTELMRCISRDDKLSCQASGGCLYLFLSALVMP